MHVTTIPIILQPHNYTKTLLSVAKNSFKDWVNASVKKVLKKDGKTKQSQLHHDWIRFLRQNFPEFRRASCLPFFNRSICEKLCLFHVF